MFFVFRLAFDIQFLLRSINTSPIVDSTAESRSVPLRNRIPAVTCRRRTERKTAGVEYEHRTYLTGTIDESPQSLRMGAPDSSTFSGPCYRGVSPSRHHPRRPKPDSSDERGMDPLLRLHAGRRSHLG